MQMELYFAATKSYFLKDMRLGFASIIQWLGVQSVTIATAVGKVVRPTFTNENPSSGHSYEGANQILSISGTFVINGNTGDAVGSLGLRLSNGPLGKVLEGIVQGPLIAANNVLFYTKYVKFTYGAPPTPIGILISEVLKLRHQPHKLCSFC